MKLLKRIVLSFVFLFLITVVTLAVITFAYENEIKDYMIQQLNKNLKTKVIVNGKDIQLTLLKNFPYASLNFKNVIMLEEPISISKSNKNGSVNYLNQDTLFALKSI